MSAAPLSLDDKYTQESGRVFLSGTQALVRLAMIQRKRDLAAGLNTAGFISGYRGSPLGGFDQALWKARKHLESHHVFFTPGVNEELAATAVWGSQQVGSVPGGEVRRRLRHVVRQGARAWTAAATCSSTPMPRARRSTAGCCSSPATITRASRRRCRTSRSTRSTRP